MAFQAAVQKSKMSSTTNPPPPPRTPTSPTAPTSSAFPPLPQYSAPIATESGVSDQPPPVNRTTKTLMRQHSQPQPQPQPQPQLQPQTEIDSITNSLVRDAFDVS